MCIEGCAVQFGKLANLLDRNLVYRLFFKQLQEAVFQHLLRIAHTGISLFHTKNSLHKRFTKINNTACHHVGYLSVS